MCVVCVDRLFGMCYMQHIVARMWQRRRFVDKLHFALRLKYALMILMWTSIALQHVVCSPSSLSVYLCGCDANDCFIGNVYVLLAEVIDVVCLIVTELPFHLQLFNLSHCLSVIARHCRK